MRARKEFREDLTVGPRPKSEPEINDVSRTKNGAPEAQMRAPEGGGKSLQLKTAGTARNRIFTFYLA